MKRVCSVAIISSLLWIANSYEYPSYRNEYGIYTPHGVLGTILIAGVTRHKKAQQNQHMFPINYTMQAEPSCLLQSQPRVENPLLNTQYTPVNGTINLSQFEFQKNSVSYGVAATQDDPWQFIDTAQRATLLEKYKDIFLKQCTVTEFKEYIVLCGVEITRQLVSHLEWWPYEVFWDYVELIPDGRDEVDAFRRSYLKNNSHFAVRAWHWFTGEYKLGAYDLVAKQYARHEERYKRKEKEKEWQRRCAQQQYAVEQAQKTKIERKCQYAQQQLQAGQLQKAKHEAEQAQRVQHKTVEDHYHADRCIMADMVRGWQESDEQQLQERVAAWNNNNEVFQEHTFTINQVQKQFFHKHQLNSDQWGMIYGSMLQKQLHAELLACIDNDVSFHDDQLFVQTVDLAHQTNRAGFVVNSSLLVDLCKAVVRGVVGGSARGMCNTVHTKLHPIDATINTIKVLGSIAQGCVQVGGTAVQLVYYYATDEQKYYTTMRDICDYNAAVCGVIFDYFSKNDAPSIAYDASYLIAETVVSGRSMRLASCWGSKFTQKLVNYAQQCAAESQLVAIGLPGLKVDGVQFFEKQKCKQKGGSSILTGKSGEGRGQAVVEEVADQAKKLTAETGKKFLKNTEFGKWLSNYCKAIPREKYKGAQVYKIEGKIYHPFLQEGDIFYLDSLHKDHIEVFYGSGKLKMVKGVFDLDGTFNTIKTDKAIFENRTFWLDR